MNIIDPNTTTHTLKIIPRFYPIGGVSLELVNEETKGVDTYIIAPVVSNGYMHLEFEKTFQEASGWRVKIAAGDEIVYRGKVFVTSRVSDTQDYKTTKDIFLL